MKGVFLTGTGTDVGKTLVAAILVEAWQADYWKPVQSGSLETTDTYTVRQLISNTKSAFHPEAYLLKAPLSPHAAAAAQGLEIDLNKILLPQTDNILVVEGAGGLLVPLNKQSLIADLIQKLQLPTVVVSANYLGSINHTLLTLEFLKSRNIPVMGLIFNGEPNPQTEDFILQYSGIRKLFSVLPEKAVSPAVIRKYAGQVTASINFES